MLIDGCRICGNKNLEPIFSFGEMPLVNNLVKDGEKSKTYPLDLVRCPKCYLVQITETVPPEDLFTEYLYFSSVSDTMLTHCRKLVNEMACTLTKDSFVIEIASNDGYLLQYYKEKGIYCLGIEPAANVAHVAHEKGIPTRVEFFGLESAQRLRTEGLMADVIHAHNVLAHIADIHGFVEGMKLILKDDGVIIIEVPYLGELIEKCAFDTIYHEHLCYFSLRPLMTLFGMHELMVTDFSLEEIHGGTLRLYVKHNPMSAFLARESKLPSDYYERFADRIENIREMLIRLITNLKKEGKRIAAYGAAAKGCVLLNTCGISRDVIDYVVDHTPAKQGLYMPGVNIPIYPPEKLLEDMPDYVLILAWNFADEILEKSKEYRDKGGKFIILVPNLLVL